MPDEWNNKRNYRIFRSDGTVSRWKPIRDFKDEVNCHDIIAVHFEEKMTFEKAKNYFDRLKE